MFANHSGSLGVGGVLIAPAAVLLRSFGGYHEAKKHDRLFLQHDVYFVNSAVQSLLSVIQSLTGFETVSAHLSVALCSVAAGF